MDSFSSKFKSNQFEKSSYSKQELNDMVKNVMKSQKQWGKHIDGKCCKCQKCICGKHICKPRSIKMPWQPGHSTYQKEFIPKKGIYGQKISMPHQKNENQSITSNSSYKKDYQLKKSESQPTNLFKRKDNIEVGGPMILATSYQQSFQNKQVSKPQSPFKNLNNLGGTGLKFNPHSSYNDTFKEYKNLKPTKSAYLKRDNLRINPETPFNYQTSYGKDFSVRKIKSKSTLDNFAPKNKYQPTTGLDSGFKTSYNRDFMGNQGGVCPATLCKCKQ